jgi:hypothetical protein
MVAEDYVSFETAKLLKEKGFDEVCFKYALNGEIYNNGDFVISHVDDVEVGIPTLQTAMKWLRKEHGLHCHSDYDIVLGWYCQITSLTETVEYDYEEMKHYHPDKDNGFSSPEEACEEAIKYCLEKLI